MQDAQVSFKDDLIPQLTLSLPHRSVDLHNPFAQRRMVA
jgi:hypothetical protein